MVEHTGHKVTSWFMRTKEASEAGIDNIYTYGIQCLRPLHQRFHEGNHHKIEAYHNAYTPNPFRYQYDLCVHIWLNYQKILASEVKYLIKAGQEFKARELEISNQIYGISRSDFLFAAAELRWPTTELEDGSLHGLFIRDPWSERRIAALSDEKIKNVISFGGGGQGKTHIALAFSLIIFDHYIFTQKGARCMLSTVNEDKLKSVGWPYLCNLNSSTVPNISLYAGRARIAGDHTLARPNNKDSGGVFKGILIGPSTNTQNIVDKLTGSHGHPFISYIMDEMQSTPDPPIVAAPNFTMHAKDYRIIGAGNYGEDTDTLGKNIKPDIGWDKVSEDSTQWVSTLTNGSKAIVLYFNNNYSPGMTDEGALKFPHLPNKRILEERYPTISLRTANNLSYRRFWVGFRLRESGSNNVIYADLVKQNGADMPLDLSRVIHNAFAFDSAPAELDRNPFLHFQEGICRQTNHRVFGFNKFYFLDKATDSLKYYQESSDQIYKMTKVLGITSGSGVVDWTGRPAHAENLQKLGFMVHKMVYNLAVQDGKRINPHTKRVEREIKLLSNVEFKNDIPASKLCAHHISENIISLGAWALRQYCIAGRVRGINQNLINDLTAERPLDLELFKRKFRYKTSSTYGVRFHLESKDDFKKLYGFSPDLLDCMFQAAYYMLVVRNLSLTPTDNDDTFIEDEQQDMSDHDDLWYGDELNLC